LAEETAHARGLTVRAHAGDATALLEDASTEAFDLVVVNPPRRGVARGAREALGRTELDKLVYVSCEPATLARDLAHFARLGLGVASLQPVDMMPHTEEIETVVTLVPAPVPPPRVLFEDDELLAVDKDPYEPTTPQGEHARSLWARVRALPGCAEAQPIHRLDRDTSGVCLFAKHASFVHGFALALGAETAQKTYLALARGVTHGKGTLSKPLVEAGKSMAVTTRYRRRAIVGGHSLLEVSPREGKKHQIRRHLASVGHPVVGDERHGDEKTARYFAEKHGLDRTFLHCHRIALVHPRTGATLELVSPLPADLEALLASLARSRGPRPKPAPKAPPRR
jgi:23S rRNA (uracil1939-C5)-methyltransferase